MSAQGQQRGVGIEDCADAQDGEEGWLTLFRPSTLAHQLLPLSRQHGPPQRFSGARPRVAINGTTPGTLMLL